MPDGSPPARPPHYDKKIGLVLQGGGSLGSYQTGVYEALASSVFGIFARLGSGYFDRCD